MRWQYIDTVAHGFIMVCRMQILKQLPLEGYHIWVDFSEKQYDYKIFITLPHKVSCLMSHVLRQFTEKSTFKLTIQCSLGYNNNDCPPISKISPDMSAHYTLCAYKHAHCEGKLIKSSY